jgi:hypothetical protein
VAVAWSRTGKLLASVCDHGDLIVRRAGDGAEMARSVQDSQSWSLAFAPGR